MGWRYHGTNEMFLDWKFYVHFGLAVNLLTIQDIEVSQLSLNNCMNVFRIAVNICLLAIK